MTNATLLSALPMIPRPVLQRSFNPEYYEFKAIDIQRIARGFIARRSRSRQPLPIAPLDFGELYPRFRLQRSTNMHELAPLQLPVLRTPVKTLLSPIEGLPPPPVMRLTREDERRRVTAQEIAETVRRLENLF